MPKELIEQENLNKATSLYRSQIKKEPYQPLSELVNKLKSIWISNSTPSLELQS